MPRTPMQQMARAVALAAALLGSAALVAAEPPKPCGDETRSHQFDFWIGEWNVTAGGGPAGTNTIRAIVDGCVILEQWRGAQGSAGSSPNHYDPSTGNWHQYWVWRNGTTLRLQGGYADGRMILTGETRDRAAARTFHRVTWYDNEDGTVRQHWEQSSDDGKTWTTAFDGLYRLQP